MVADIFSQVFRQFLVSTILAGLCLVFLIWSNINLLIYHTPTWKRPLDIALIHTPRKFQPSWRHTYVVTILRSAFLPCSAFPSYICRVSVVRLFVSLRLCLIQRTTVALHSD